MIKKREQKSYRQVKNLKKQQKKERITKKFVENFNCKRCKTNFTNNIKLHQHVRERHAKKFKSIVAIIIFATSSFVRFVL